MTDDFTRQVAALYKKIEESKEDSDEYHNLMNEGNILRLSSIWKSINASKLLKKLIVNYNSDETKKYEADGVKYIHEYISRFKINTDVGKQHTMDALFLMWSNGGEKYKKILHSLLSDIVDDANYEGFLLEFYKKTKNRQTIWNSKNIKIIKDKLDAKGEKKVEKKVAVADAGTLPSDNELAKLEQRTPFVDSKKKDKSEDSKSDDEEKEDESIKINLQTMLTKLPQPDDKKTEEQYRREYIDINNKGGELFTYEEEKEDDVHSIGGRTQKKKKKRVQNRRRQKTIKNKV